MFKVIIIIIMSFTSILYSKLEVSGGYNSSFSVFACSNGEKITDPKGVKLELLYKLELLSDVYIDIGTSVNILSETSTPMIIFDENNTLRKSFTSRYANPNLSIGISGFVGENQYIGFGLSLLIGKIGASKTQCSAEGNSFQLQPHINIKIYSNKYLYVGVKTGVMIGSPLTGYFISSNIIF